MQFYFNILKKQKRKKKFLKRKVILNQMIPQPFHTK